MLASAVRERIIRQSRNKALRPNNPHALRSLIASQNPPPKCTCDLCSPKEYTFWNCPQAPWTAHDGGAGSCAVQDDEDRDRSGGALGLSYTARWRGCCIHGSWLSSHYLSLLIIFLHLSLRFMSPLRAPRSLSPVCPQLHHPSALGVSFSLSSSSFHLSLPGPTLPDSARKRRQEKHVRERVSESTATKWPTIIL
jgi:hypothetical protein